MFFEQINSQFSRSTTLQQQAQNQKPKQVFPVNTHSFILLFHDPAYRSLSDKWPIASA
jgi:hypothetical protein